MEIYKLKLSFNSPLLTPLHADIVFGHLCWVIAYREGAQALEQFLRPFKENKPPFTISDGLPIDLFPKPLTVEFLIENWEKSKEMKKSDFLLFEDFKKVIKGEKIEYASIPKNVKSSLIPHNTISRLTNTTLQEGGVYSLEEKFISELNIFIKSSSKEWIDRLEELFFELSKSGFGRKKSIGKGHFTLTKIELFDELEYLENPNGFVTLSNFCPAKDDPAEGYYKTFVKYGKLGEEFTFSGNPFKKPLIMIKTGSVFKTDGPPREYYGRMVEKVSESKPEVVQYAYAFAIPIRWPDG